MTRSKQTTCAKLGNNYKGNRPIVKEDSYAEEDSDQQKEDYLFERMRKSDRARYIDDGYYGDDYDAPSMWTASACKTLKRRVHPGHLFLPLKDYDSGKRLGFGMVDTTADRNLMPMAPLRKLGYELPKMDLTPDVNFTNGTHTLSAGSLKLKVKIGSFVYPIEFLCHDLPFSESTQCILGTPFLGTSRAMIDYRNKKIMLSVGRVVESYDITFLPDYKVKPLKDRKISIEEYQAEVDKEPFPCPVNYKRQADKSVFSVSVSSSESESLDANYCSTPMKKTARIRIGGKRGRNSKRINRRKATLCGRQLTLLIMDDNFKTPMEEDEGSCHADGPEESKLKEEKD